MVSPKLAVSTQCSGCSACMNICPCDAIVMQEDENGFIMPDVDLARCVGCGQCSCVCPAQHISLNNTGRPACYAFRASDEIRRQSTSGALFPILASHTLDVGGIVAGAAYDDSWNVKHILAECADGVALMRGTKYAQSQIGFIFREIRDILSRGRQVFFTGVPCQVAGLKAFLPEPDAHLFTADLVCHGVPASGCYKRYIAEIAAGRVITAVKFRDKRYGWLDNTVTRIEFADGSWYEQRDDMYMKGFFSHLTIRDSCLECPFSGSIRQGDITIGDFWGYNRMPGGDDENEGTSLLLINNAKGQILLDYLKSTGMYLKPIESDNYRYFNRFWTTHKDHPARRRFFDMLLSKSFSESVNAAINNSYDVGIVGPYTNRNLGGFLTYYALYHTVVDMGFTSLMIDFPTEAPWGGNNRSMAGFADCELYPPYAVAPPYQTTEDMRELNSRCGQFLVGSDQIFRPDFFIGWGKVFQLDWVEDSKKKIAYASSMGIDKFACDDDLRAEMSYFLGKFDAFSVREDLGIEICRDYLDVKAVRVLDPVFLCNRKHYDRLADNAKDGSVKEPFMHGYILTATPDKQKVLESVCKELNLKPRIYHGSALKQNLSEKSSVVGTVNLRLRDMRDCAFSVVDSFHGLCFAIYFEKNFIVMPNQSLKDSRLLTLLNDTGLERYYVKSYEDFLSRKNELFSPISYEEVRKKFNPRIQQSRVWLESQLKQNKIKTYSTYDLARRMINRMEITFNAALAVQEKRFMQALEQQSLYIALSSRNISWARGDMLETTRDLGDYITNLKERLADLALFILSSDTPCGTKQFPAITQLKSLGLETDLNLCFRHAYIALISGGELLYENVTNGPVLEKKQLLGGHNIAIRAISFGAGQKVKFIIDDINIPVGRRGLNFVVMDKKLGKILDVANFDTYLPTTPRVD